jgi:hypothetical protein
MPAFDHQVLGFDVPGFAERGQAFFRTSPRVQLAHLAHLRCLLRLGGEWRGEETTEKRSDKRPPIHEVPGVRISASACSGQKRMSISRYIVAAIVRCSCACRLPVRR